MINLILALLTTLTFAKSQVASYQCNVPNYHQFKGGTGNIAINGTNGECVWYIENSILGPSRIFVEYTARKINENNSTDMCTLDNKQVIRFDYTELNKPKCTIQNPAK
jgi:hypothetical protein